MKIAVLSIGVREQLSQKNIRSVESVYFEKYKNLEGHNVVFIDKKIKEELFFEQYHDLYDYTNLNKFDCVYIHNSSFIFFGGVINDVDSYKLKLILSFYLSNGGQNIYYLVTDPKLIAPIKKIKETFKRLKVNLTEKEINSLAELFYSIKISATCLDWSKLGYENECFEHIPLFEFIGINSKKNELIDCEKIYDCVYFGNNRGSYRTNLVKSVFSNSLIKTKIFGFELLLPNNDCVGYIDRNELLLELNKSYSTILISDKEHESNWITARYFEAINNNLLAFTYWKYDQYSKFIVDENLREHLVYVAPQKILKTLNKIKKDKSLYDDLLLLQKNELKKFEHLKIK